MDKGALTLPSPLCGGNLMSQLASGEVLNFPWKFGRKFRTFACVAKLMAAVLSATLLI